MARKRALAPELYATASRPEDQRLMQRMAEQDITPVATDCSLPRFTVLVGHSPFTMPRGWEFYLTTPYEGVSSIATVAHNAGYPTRIVDVRYALDPVAEATRQILEGTDVLGVATFEDNFPFTREVIAAVKRAAPQIPILCGGSLVTSVPHVFMEHTDTDIAVISEGELTIQELLDSVARETLRDDLPQIRGVWWRGDDGQVLRNLPRGQMPHLDCLPRPVLDLWPQASGPLGLQPQIITSYSRGCRMDCSFCFRTTPCVSAKSPERFAREMDWFKARYGVEFLFMCDLTFNADKRQTIEMCEVLQDHDVRFTSMCRCADADAERLAAMKKAGCDVILYGVESLGQSALREVHKPTTENISLRAMHRTFEAGIRFGTLLIVGLPGETEQGLEHMARFAEEFHHMVRVKYLSALPGTPVYNDLLRRGLIRDELSHLEWLSIEQCLEPDEFLNVNGLDEQLMRDTYRRIYEAYQPGPVMDFQHWPDHFEYHAPIADDGKLTSVAYAGTGWRAGFSSAGPWLAPGSQRYTLERLGATGAAATGASRAISGAKRMGMESS
jgi:radical SAM superfamily enzyme YgiQ (UPF0313 family)